MPASAALRVERIDRIGLLRDYETLVYTICRRLAGSDRAAEETAREALIRLYRNDAFLNRAEARDAIVRREAVAAWQRRCAAPGRR